MSFNAQAFREEAKRNNLTEDEINSVIARETAGAVPLTSEPTKQEVQVAPAGDWLKPALIGGGTAAALLAAKAAFDKYTNNSNEDVSLNNNSKEKKVYGSLKEKVQSERIEPQLDVSSRKVQTEPTFDNIQPVAENKQVAPTLEELKTKFGLSSENTSSISDAVSTPEKTVAPAPTDTPPLKPVEPAAPITPVAPTTTAEVVTDPNATPVEKAVTLTQEAPPAGAVQPKPVKGTPEYTNAKRQLIEQQISTFQNRPQQTAAVQKYVAENPLNPHNRDWLHSQFGAETGNVIMQAGLGPNSNTDQVYQAASDYRAGKYPAIPRVDPNATPASELSAAGKKGWAFSNTPQDWISMQRGKSSIPMMGTLAMAGVLGIAGKRAYDHGQKTGDWSELAKIAVPTGVGLVNAGAGMATDVAMNPEAYKPGFNLGSPIFSALTNLVSSKVKDKIQENKVGAGRGMQGVPPPNR